MYIKDERNFKSMVYKIIKGETTDTREIVFIGNHQECRNWIVDKTFDYYIDKSNILDTVIKNIKKLRLC